MHHTAPPHNCNELKSDISLLLDGEMDRHKENRLLEEIKNCPACQQYYNSHAAYKKNVSQKFNRRCCGEHIKDALRAKIRGL
jgi:predicted anti-sigma-YlaC factor YlaD